MTVPNIVDWDRITGFRFTKSKVYKEYYDIKIDQFIDSFSDIDKIQVETLKGRRVLAVDDNGDKVDEWPAYKCIYAEMNYDANKYILSAGVWYKIELSFVKSINRQYSSIDVYGVDLPEYNDASEGEYNKRVAEENNDFYALMDNKLISHGGRYGKIEFCDLFTTQKDIIHVKRYGGSSVLSHLMAQGLNSGELFKTDEQFREKVNVKLPGTHQLSDTSKLPEPDEYRIVYAVVSEKTGPLDMPFFSKISLVTARRTLRGLGFKVELAKIEVNERKRKKVKYPPKKA